MSIPPGASARQLHRTVWVLGLVSLLMDVSSEMIHGLLPVFLVGTLGVSAFRNAFEIGRLDLVAELFLDIEQTLMMLI